MNFKIGDTVLCIKEIDLPQFVGKIWTIKDIYNNLFFCENLNVYSGIGVEDHTFPFKPDEIVPVSTLIKELV